jgi:DnaJ-class molecular chaperone
MDYHGCPIEPYDWNNGDGNHEEGDECPDCQGSGELQSIVDDLLRVRECSRCQGTGSVMKEYEPLDDDYF